MVGKANLARFLHWANELVKDSKLLFSNEKGLVGMGIKPVARWAKLVTSQNNPWMTATRLHESGHHEDAWLHYIVDAKNSRAAGLHSRAGLSLALAADCLESIGQMSLASKMLESAGRCYVRQASTSTCPEEATWARIQAERLFEISRDWKMETPSSEANSDLVSFFAKHDPMELEKVQL